jgi:sensor histidine kinase YesM
MILNKRSWLYHPLSRLTQHLVFWVLSYIVFVQLFKTGVRPEKIDYIYSALFHGTIIPAVYINLGWLLPRLANYRRWGLYVPAVIALIVLFSWLHYSFFQDWSKYILPDYFFISYFTVWEVGLFFVVYIALTSLLKLSRSWFVVNDLQRRLLQMETEKIQIELKALKSQVNPHFFFNTLNGIYSMTLDKDERLPQTILQLSHLMRYLLYESGEDLVPLEKEWQVLQDYIALQRIRSNENLQLEKAVEGEIRQQRIAPLLLISFLENAFKHGAKGNTGPVSIHLWLQVLPHSISFRVQNTRGQVDEVEYTHYKGVGLENVRRRLELLYPGKHSLLINETEHDFIVTLQLQV